MRQEVLLEDVAAAESLATLSTEMILDLQMRSHVDFHVTPCV